MPLHGETKREIDAGGKSMQFRNDGIVTAVSIVFNGSVPFPAIGFKGVSEPLQQLVSHRS